MHNTNDIRKPFSEIDGLYEKINEIIYKDRILLDEVMSNHTSFKIGGTTAAMVEIAEADELLKLVPLLVKEDAKYFIMGNGSNLLVSDEGYTGIVIKLADYLTNVTIDKDEITAESGVLLSTLSKIIAKESLIGFEFASGIPGTVGGAIAMNAGAYDGEMKQCVKSVKVLTQSHEIIELTNEEMNFGYRMSDVKIHDYIVLETTFKLKKGDCAEIASKTKDFTERRTSKQPLTLPSAGSMFKRPIGYFAGKLIDDSGLRGVRIGDAQVSEKHCGFVVNRGSATCRDILDLIQMVQKVVKDKYGVVLETEVKYLGG